MSETPEHPTETTGPVSAQSFTAPPSPPPPPPPPPAPVPPVYTAAPPYRPSRVNQVAAWVGIVAGSVFVVAVIFGTGFMVGKHTGDRGFDRHEAVLFKQRGGPPPMFPMGSMGEFERGPFIVPNGPGLQPPQSPGAPTTTAPVRP